MYETELYKFRTVISEVSLYNPVLHLSNSIFYSRSPKLIECSIEIIISFIAGDISSKTNTWPISNTSVRNGPNLQSYLFL